MNYTREQKIKYFTNKIAYFESKIAKARERLAIIESDEYQDFNSDLDKELERKKLVEEFLASLDKKIKGS